VTAIERQAITQEIAAMNKTLTTSALTIIIVAIVSGAVSFARPVGAAAAAQTASRAVALPDLPPGLLLPDRLPKNIRDPQLLTAWIELYNHAEPIALWDGHDLTGRDLAQFVLDHNIPVTWDATGVCGGGSCSVLSLTAGGWVYDRQVPGVDPIFIQPTLRPDSVGVLNALAHEIFHRTQPFGPVADTQFEEYWAYRVGNAIASKPWPVFDGYDPLVSGWLFLWLRDNNLGAYYPLASYPPVIEQLLASPD
jgi:hypothetical protein